MARPEFHARAPAREQVLTAVGAALVPKGIN